MKIFLIANLFLYHCNEAIYIRIISHAANDQLLNDGYVLQVCCMLYKHFGFYCS